MRDGFSIVEVLVAVLIISLIAVIGAGSYRYRRQERLDPAQLVAYLNGLHIQSLAQAKTVEVTFDLDRKLIWNSLTSERLRMAGDTRMRVTYGNAGSAAEPENPVRATLVYWPDARSNGAKIEVQADGQVAKQITISWFTGLATIDPPE